MSIHGQNIVVSIYRKNSIADDIYGGRRYSLLTLHSSILARLSAVRPSMDLLTQGIQTDKIFNMILQPSDLDVKEEDVVIPESGAWSGSNFRVTGVRVDSILPNDARSHLSIGLERMESARTAL